MLKQSLRRSGGRTRIKSTTLLSHLGQKVVPGQRAVEYRAQVKKLDDDGSGAIAIPSLPLPKPVEDMIAMDNMWDLVASTIPLPFYALATS